MMADFFNEDLYKINFLINFKDRIACKKLQNV